VTDRRPEHAWFWEQYDAGARLAQVVADHDATVRSDLGHVGSADGIATLGIEASQDPKVVVGFEEETTDRDALAATARDAGLPALAGDLSFRPIHNGALPCDAAVFDAMIVTGLTRLRQAINLMREVRRVLRPDGIVVIDAKPLYHSAYGSQLPPELVPPFAHLLESPEDIARSLHERVGTDNGYVNALLDRFNRLSRLTADEMQQVVVAGDLRIETVELHCEPTALPPSLQHHAITDLAVAGITIVASPW
jgi:SAM-dependent methyltransferase